MAMVTEVRDGLELDYHNISFLSIGKDRSPERIEDFCSMYWGEVKGSVLVSYKGIYYLCDGVDPTTGTWFAEDVKLQFLTFLDSVEYL